MLNQEQAAAPSDRPGIVAAVVGLVLLAAWEATGWDMTIAGWFGTPTGFPLQDGWWTEKVAHEGGRAVAYVVMLLMVLDTAFLWLRGPSRRERVFWLIATIICIIAVPALKRFSDTSCPWDLTAFGGKVPHVPHWMLGVSDGGPGRCFPSGHAVAAFAYFSLYFLWRGTRPVFAVGCLIGVAVAGAVFGVGQLARGAHFPSHTLWSAWLCWVFYLAASGLRRIGNAGNARRSQPLSN